MEHLPANVFDAGDVRYIRLNMKPCTDSDVRAVKHMLLIISGRLIRIGHSVRPRRTIVQPTDPDHGRVEFDVWSQIEALNVRLQVLDIFRQRYMVGGVQWHSMIGEAGQLYARNQFRRLVGAIIERSADICFTETK